MNQMILEMLETIKSGFGYLTKYIEEENIERFLQLSKDIKDGFEQILAAVGKNEESVYVELNKGCKNCLYSLRNICVLYGKNELEKASYKIEFELFPIYRIIYARFYYMAFVNGDSDKEKEFWNSGKALELVKNYYVEESEKKGEYKYDISIYVTAYNNLEYTRECVKYLLENIPRTLRCELILINHGSENDVKEFFEYINPEKQVDILINSVIGFWVPSLIAEGKYILNISNDVIIGRNAIDLMYQMMEEDSRIGYVVPMTTNISNLQGIPYKELKFKTIEEFIKYSLDYNKRILALEEERFRLLNPLSMHRTNVYNNDSKALIAAKGLFGVLTFMFGDDILSINFRRAGYKCILMRDVICFHKGSMTSSNEKYNYLEGRKNIYDYYGIDPWGKGFCWTYELFNDERLQFNIVNSKKILGINTGLGSDSLKIKEKIYEKTGVKAHLTNITMDKSVYDDLRGISDEVKYINTWDEIIETVSDKYDYILCSEFEDNDINRIIDKMRAQLSDKGTLIIQLYNNIRVKELMDLYNSDICIEGEECGKLQENGHKTYFVVIKKGD